jgi:hypothetical protein
MVVEGRLMAGPTPQINPPRDGERKNDARMSLTPKAASPPSKSGGWLTSGTMTRMTRFQSLFSANGITG